MNTFGTTARIVIVLVSMPLAVWLGAVLTREGRPLARMVDRHFRLLVVGLLVMKMCVSLMANDLNARTGQFLELTAIYLMAMLFVPMLRRLQGRTDQALRAKRVKQGHAEPKPRRSTGQ